MLYTLAPLEYCQSVLIIGLSVFQGLKMFNIERAICGSANSKPVYNRGVRFWVCRLVRFHFVAIRPWHACTFKEEGDHMVSQICVATLRYDVYCTS